MSCRSCGSCILSPTAVLLHLKPTRLSRKIILPRLPAIEEPPTLDAAGEYHRHKHLRPDLDRYLDRSSADTLRRQRQLGTFRRAAETSALGVWRDSKAHLRQQERLVHELGVEGAVREVLQPTRVSFRRALQQRPLDRGILEEVYKGLHGRRIERRLKRGVSWEHWITKGDGTAPVFSASIKAQQTFAFGGQIRLVARATHSKQFPTVFANGGDSSDGNTRHPTRVNHSTHKRECKNGTKKDDTTHVKMERPLVPEVAFIGRTSSGKSSLVNAILNAMVAPYGHLQGTTSGVGFYSVANRVMLVDCPGYGYYNPMETPSVDAENAVATMRCYLDACSPRRRGAGGRPMKRVFVCVSARGLQHVDVAYLDRLEELAVPFSVVITKTDAAPIRFLARLADHTRCQLVHYKHCKELMLASSLRLAGIDKIQNLIGSMALGEDKLNGATNDFSAIV